VAEDQLVSKSDFHKTMIDWLLIQGVNNPENYLTDPQSPGAVQAAQAAQQQQQQQQQVLLQLEEQTRELEEVKVKLDKYMHDTELEFKYAKEGIEAEKDEAELTATTTLKVIELDQGADDNEQATLDRRAAGADGAGG
jgi:hypothetical protein